MVHVNSSKKKNSTRKEKRVPLLILAQSGRFLAQSATQAGYRVWVADCFGDQDMQDVSERWLTLPPLSTISPKNLSQVLSKLSNGEGCYLICGSGIESCYDILKKLPTNIKLLGNSFQTIQAIKNPTLFFNTLEKHQLNFPETVFSPPTSTTEKRYLAKSSKGLGGIHINYVNNTESYSEDYYFQDFIEGLSGSILFLADGNNVQLISINQQFTVQSDNKSFCLHGITADWDIDDKHQKQLLKAIKLITEETGLVGLNSLDFIISNKNELFILEVNPRPSSSAELIEQTPRLFQAHLNACEGLLPKPNTTDFVASGELQVLFAGNDYKVASKVSWPIESYDRPIKDTLITKGQPICTIIIKMSSSSFKTIEKNIIEQLSSD